MAASDYIATVAVLVSIGTFLHSHHTSTKKYELFTQYRAELINWFHETSTVLIRLKLEAESNFPNKDLQRELLAKLSAGIEKGRFYLPNIDEGGGFGAHKPPGFRGFRNAALDFLVFSYRIFEKEDPKHFIKHAETLQRYYTSIMLELVNPRTFIKETGGYTEKILSNNLSFEDYMTKDPDLIKAYIRKYT